MPLTRRQTLGLAGATFASALLPSRSKAAPSEISTVIFDVFAILNPRPILESLETIAPGRSKELGALWWTRQMEYAWLRTVAGEHRDYWKITLDALVYAADALRIPLAPRTANEIMEGYLTLQAWPDTREALEALKAQGLKLAVLSNFSPRMLNAAINSASLAGTFAKTLSTEGVRTYKPDPRAYRMAVEVLRTPRRRILYATSADWDVAGAKWFGYETFWLNRLRAQPEMLGVEADGRGNSLDDLIRYLRLRV